MTTTIRNVVLMLVVATSVYREITAQDDKEKPNDFSVRMILFIEEGAEPPQDYQKCLGSLATRTESYFAEWMKHWKRDVERTTIFARDDAGEVSVTLVKGKLKNAAGRNALPEMRRIAKTEAMDQLKLSDDDRVVWWIFYDYPDMRGFQGGGNATGGTAINKYPVGAGEFGQTLELAAPSMVKAKAKGMIHEFGHALGLPHNGPRPGVQLGNSLMGPINRSYDRKVGAGESRVYLNETSAAILWKHPVFRAASSRKPELPRMVQAIEVKVEEDAAGSTFTVTGKLRSDQSAHTAIVFDSADRGFGDYWTRSYTGAFDDQGQFSLQVKEPFDSGKLMLFFCFESGVNTGNDEKQLMQGAVIEIPYSGVAGERIFELPK